MAAANAERFFGAHQAGIASPMQDALYFATFDLATEKREDVITLLQNWTNAAARRLLFASIIYLPSVLLMMFLDKR